MDLHSKKDGLTILAALFGSFFLAGGLFDIKWIYDHAKTQIFIDLFGRRGVRILYIVLGAGLILYAVFNALS